MVVQVSGITRRRLQLLVEEGYLTPLARGKRYLEPQTFSVMQCVACAYGECFRKAGIDQCWRDEAIAFVARLTIADLLAAFKEGRVLLSLVPEATEQSRLVQPYLKPGASREDRVMLANLDLSKCYYRTLKRLHETVGVTLGSPPQPPLDL
jgi:hypothetical protein